MFSHCSLGQVSGFKHSFMSEKKEQKFEILMSGFAQVFTNTYVVHSHKYSLSDTFIITVLSLKANIHNFLIINVFVPSHTG